VRAVSRLCELEPGICLTTEEKARKNLSQGSRTMPAGTMKTIGKMMTCHPHVNIEKMYANVVYILKVSILPDEGYK